MVDTGASNSIINYHPASRFNAYHFKHPFTVSSLRNIIHADDNIQIPLFQEFGISDPIHLHVVDWHSHFDALLGSRDLHALHAKIDYQTNTLRIHDVDVPFTYSTVTRDSPSPPSVSLHNILTIPVTVPHGPVIIPELCLTDCLTTPEAIAVARDGFCQIPNPFADYPLNVNFHEPIPVTPLADETILSPTWPTTCPSTVSSRLRLDHLNTEEKQAIIRLCQSFYDVFYQDSSPLSFTNAIKHKIRTTTDSPIYVKAFRHPHAMQGEIQNQIQALLDNKIIQPSLSPYSAPVWLVPKKADASGRRKFRLVIDYRALNEKTIADKYPLPRIDDILDNLGKCKYFSTIDLAQGFHQIEMDPTSVEKTAFSCPNGHFEFLRLPFGLKNSPSTFQRVMDNIFREYLHKFCFIYVDDIVVFSKSLDEHLHHLKLIFTKLRQFTLKIQLDKSEFLRKDVEFLGHVVTPTGIKPNPSKIVAVENFPVPQSEKELKSFLGLAGYYRRFIPNFAHIVSPMTKFLKKGIRLDPTDTSYLHAFSHLKELLTNSPILIYPDFNKTFTLTTDASNVALGSVLSQGNLPIAYYSRILNSAERNYSTIEKELLAILDSCKNFRPYLYGHKFIIQTDHNPLVWLHKIKEPNSRLLRWRLKLDEFDFTVAYKRGKDNVVADALSRIELHNSDTTSSATSLTPDQDDTLSIQPCIDDADAAAMRNQQHIDSLPSVSTLPSDAGTAHSARGENGKDVPISERTVNTFQNRLILTVGETFKTRISRPFQKSTYHVTVTLKCINEDLTAALKQALHPPICLGVYFSDQQIRRPFLQVVKSLFNSSIKLAICNVYVQDVTDFNDQTAKTLDYHEVNHNGISETFNKLKTKYYWPNMLESISKIINKCDVCLQSKYERHPYKVDFLGPLLAKRPFHIVHLDTFGFGGAKFLTIIDLFSKYAQAYRLDDATGISILNKLRHYFAHHNKPFKIVCDEGREFHNKTFIEFCKFHKIELHYTTVYNPNSNTPIERFHLTILEKLRTLLLRNPNDTPCSLMTSAILIYNESIHSTTGFSPFYLLYGPYDKVHDVDLDMTLYEQYNERRRQEILSLYDAVYEMVKDRATDALNKQNVRLGEPPPDTVGQDVYTARNRSRKTDPPFQKINVTEQTNTKVTGRTQHNRLTTANLRNTKRLRKKSYQPGTSQVNVSRNHGGNSTDPSHPPADSSIHS